jgi:hypothetical protein
MVYKEWSGRELMNEIKENNYDVNVLWKGNIAYLWVLEMILFRRYQTTLILVDHETDCVEKIISLSFHAYEEPPNWRSHASCALIWRQSSFGLRIENKHGK